MQKKPSIWRLLVTIGSVCAYLGLTLILIVQALTPGKESGNISNNVGDKINSAITQIDKPKVERVDVANISIDALRVGDVSLPTQNATMKAGDTGTLVTTVSPADASNKSLLFASSDDSVLKVYSDGRVQALQEGGAIITVTSQDNPNIQKTIAINVTGIRLEGLKLVLPNTTFEPNKTYGCDLTYLPANTTELSVVWTSSNPAVLTVDELGKITTLSEGSAVVTVTSALYPNILDSVEITVAYPPEPEKILVQEVNVTALKVGETSLPLTNTTMTIGEQGKLSCNVLPTDASNKSLAYTSSDPSIVKVYADGKVEALAVGSAEIIISAQDGSNVSTTLPITVKGITLQGLSLTLPTTEFYPEKTYVIDLAYAPANTTEKEVYWESSNPSVLTVSQTGQIQTLAEGTATVTVTSTLYPNISDSVEITVAYPPEPEKIPVQQVSITALKVGSTSLSLTNPTMKIGEQGKLSSKVLPSDASNKSLTYTSSAPAIVQVYADGTVKALSKGEATITIASEENPSIQATITITVIEIPVTKLTISNQKTSLYVGNSHALEVVYTPTDTTQKDVVWSSSNKSVLTVSSKGVIKGIKEGTATVTVTSSENSAITASYTVTVSIKPPDPEVLVTGITMKNKTEIGYVKSTHTLSATVSPSNATNKGVIWSTSDASVATVSQKGAVTFLKAGQVTITVKSAAAEYSDSVTITVKEVLSSTITLTIDGLDKVSEQEYTITEFNSANLEATLDANATVLTVVFQSSDPSIAKISQNGVIEALKPGTTTITASTSYDGKTTSTSFTLTVLAKIPDVESITISHAEEHELVYIGGTCTLQVAFYPIESTDSLVWSSSDTAIATVTQDGKVSFLKAGTVTITAKCSSFPVENSLTITVKEVLSKTITLTNEGLTSTGENTYSITRFDSASLYATLDANATILKVDFSSSNPSIATIGQDGVIEALQRGSTTITVSTSYEGQTTSVSFTLLVLGLLPDVESMELLHAHEFGYVGSSCTLSAVFYPETATDGLAWSSSDTSVATVSQSGKVTYHKAGTVTITAKCNSFNVEQSLTITVKEVLSKNISLLINGLSKNEDGTYSLKEGKSAKIGAVLDANATILQVEFTSSDPAVAKIGQDGSIEALSAGVVTITVSSSYDGETTSESITLTIIGLTFKDTMQNFYLWVRKGFGHFGAFLVLGFFAVLTFYNLFPKSTKGKLLGFVLCLVAGFAIAGLTEIFQLPFFTEGRYCSFDDVLLDFKGYCTSTLVMYFFIFVAHFISLYIAKKAPKEEPIEQVEETYDEVSVDIDPTTGCVRYTMEMEEVDNIF
ncbi:MAG: VanZ family protein [Clostridia bacterium]|nr:VanZ family protein [Clostridia bacterium]